MSNEPKEVLTVTGLTKKYGDYTAVNSLDISVHQGEIYGCLGPNGAGKTTTIECILGLTKYHEGEITLLGQRAKDMDRALLEQIGVQFQASRYPDRIKVWEMCEMTHALYSSAADWQPQIARFGLGDKKDQMVHSLSGGEQQKLSIVLALINQPKIVFLDELTTGLDPRSRRDVWQHLGMLKKRGITVFLTSHYMDEVEFLCDRLCIVKQGKKMVEGTPQAIMRETGKTSLDDAYLYYADEEALS